MHHNYTHHRSPNHWQNHNSGYHMHMVGATALNLPLLTEQQQSQSDSLRDSSLEIVYDLLHQLSERSLADEGMPLPVNEEGVRRAYIAQDARLRDEHVTSMMSSEQRTAELMAKAILFAPQASDAIKTHRFHNSKATLSRYNDMIGDVARSLPLHMQPGYKAAVVTALDAASHDLNSRIGHNSEVSSEDPESGIDQIWSIFHGVVGEIAPENAIKKDSSIELIIPKDTASDLVGIDAQVRRRSDGKTINIDFKSHGKYLSAVAKKMHVEWVEESGLKPYYYVGQHENGYSHFLLNSSAFGEIPDDSVEYTPLGQEKLRQTIHEMLEYNG